MIGDRLKLARRAAGLSLRALAARMQDSVTAQAIGRYERNEIMPSSGVLLALARALDVAPEYLLSRRDFGLQRIQFRKAPGVGAKEERAVGAKLLTCLERHVVLEEALNLPTLVWRNPLERLGPILEIDDAHRAATQLRVVWNLGVDAIPSMTELLEERGVKVIYLPLPVSISGSKAIASLSGNRSLAAVVVNSEHTGERQRFTLAHELGHLVLKFSKKVSRQVQEKAMDRFAGEFLVPSTELRRLVGESRSEVSLGELLELKAHFKVSLQCLVVRLKQCSILSKSAAGRHWQVLDDSGYLVPPFPEPGPIEREQSHRLHRLVLRAVSESAISESKAAELLAIPQSMLQDKLDQGFHVEAA